MIQLGVRDITQISSRLQVSLYLCCLLKWKLSVRGSNLCSLAPPVMPVRSHEIVKGFKARGNSIIIGDNPAWCSCEVVMREILNRSPVALLVGLNKSLWSGIKTLNPDLACPSLTCLEPLLSAARVNSVYSPGFALALCSCFWNRLIFLGEVVRRKQ